VRVWEWDGGAKTQWDPVGMGIILKLGNANGKELGGNGSVKNPFPVTSIGVTCIQYIG